ncbi:MAG TPA: hemolysin family protein [Sedimentisphaerales bacterium]|nr:hemolysin family protein [Sedimentisphaerales bacterium]
MVIQIVLMLLLLAGSAFFSGVETAFFNLSRRQVNLLSQSKHKLQKLVARLLNKPKQLLSCLLFGNMTVNVLFYAVASVLAIRMGEQIGAGAAAITAFISFAVLVLFGEILPKSLAYANSKSISVAAALPLVLCLQIYAPLQFVFRVFMVEPALRLLLGPAQRTKPISTGEFKSLIKQVQKRGLISADENKLLAEIVEFGFLKVRHVMRPRVDMVACDVSDSAELASEKMLKNHLTKLPVYVRTIDNVVGLVYLRQLLLEGDTTLDKIVQPVDFVPEQKTVESLLEFFRKMGMDTAIVVDEYGGIAGLVRLEDIAEELLGPIEITEGMEPVESIGPFEYRLAGDISIHDWAEAFGIDPEEAKISTIGGLVTVLLGKIPKSGDVAYLKNLKFTVERVQKHRIETIILTLEAAGTNGQ